MGGKRREMKRVGEKREMKRGLGEEMKRGEKRVRGGDEEGRKEG
jgi:hypothetical protein